MKEYDFYIELAVRDYELDLQGIVNNAVYQNYLEHCRHCYLREIGFGISNMHAKGYDPVLIRAEIDYIQPLVSGDKFIVGLKVATEGRLRYIFHQEIVRNSKVICKAKFAATVIREGVPIFHPNFQSAIENFRVSKSVPQHTRLQ